jgi:hypothetical protein
LCSYLKKHVNIKREVDRLYVRSELRKQKLLTVCDGMFACGVDFMSDNCPYKKNSID